MIDTMAALNCTHLICPALMRDKFDSADGVREVCDTLNEAAEVCKENGLSLGYHNHYWEFTDFGDENASQVMFQHLDTLIFFELDTSGIGHRLPDTIQFQCSSIWAHVFHSCTSKMDQRPLRVIWLQLAGSGVMDITAIVEAGKEHTDWLVIELDRCVTDMMEAVEKSYDYLVSEGLARGNK